MLFLILGMGNKPPNVTVSDSICFLYRTLWIYYKTSSWIYPVFNVLSGWQKVAFMQGALVGITILYFVGEALQQTVLKGNILLSARPLYANLISLLHLVCRVPNEIAYTGIH